MGVLFKRKDLHALSIDQKGELSGGKPFLLFRLTFSFNMYHCVSLIWFHNTEVLFLRYSVQRLIRCIFHSSDTFSRNGGAEKSLMDAVNRQMRKVENAEKVELHNVAPLAIRCALKNVSPCNLVRPLRLCIIYL